MTSHQRCECRQHFDVGKAYIHLFACTGFAVLVKEISVDMEVDLRIRGTQFELNDVSLAVQKAKLLKDRIRGDIASMMEKRFNG